MRGSVVLVLSLLAAATCATSQELRLGDVPIPIGGSEAAVLAKLRERFAVRPIQLGSWEIRSRQADDTRTPLVAVVCENGKIVSVAFNYGPDRASFLDVMYEQLSRALPEYDKCEVETSLRPLEGGQVRRLRFVCHEVTIDSDSGAWPSGANASIRLTKRDPGRRRTRG